MADKPFFLNQLMAPIAAGKSAACERILDRMIESATARVGPFPVPGIYRLTTPKGVDGWPDLKIDPIDPADFYASLSTAELVAAETEKWCRRAKACGPGTRLWWSGPNFNEATMQYQYDIALLPPGQEPPGAGTVFEPWDEAE